LSPIPEFHSIPTEELTDSFKNLEGKKKEKRKKENGLIIIIIIIIINNYNTIKLRIIKENIH